MPDLFKNRWNQWQTYESIHEVQCFLSPPTFIWETVHTGMKQRNLFLLEAWEKVCSKQITSNGFLAYRKTIDKQNMPVDHFRRAPPWKSSGGKIKVISISGLPQRHEGFSCFYPEWKASRMVALTRVLSPLFSLDEICATVKCQWQRRYFWCFSSLFFYCETRETDNNDEVKTNF